MENLIGVKAVCALLGLSRPTLYKLIQTKKLPASYYGKAWKFKPSDIEEFVENRRAK